MSETRNKFLASLHRNSFLRVTQFKFKGILKFLPLGKGAGYLYSKEHSSIPNNKQFCNPLMPTNQAIQPTRTQKN